MRRRRWSWRCTGLGGCVLCVYTSLSLLMHVCKLTITHRTQYRTAAYIFQYPAYWPDTHGLLLRLLLSAAACGPAVLERTAHALVTKLLEQTVRVVKTDEVGWHICFFTPVRWHKAC